MKEPSAAELLREYFRRSGDAVLYIEKDRVTFATPAACALLGRNAEGQLLERLFPLWPEEDGGVAAVELGGRGCRVIRSRLPGADCLRLQPEGEAVPAPAALLQRLRSSLAALRLSTDRLVDPETESPYAPVLNRSYYAMLHGVQQLSDRNAILRGDMALRRDAVELGKLLWELTGSVDTFAGERGVELTCDVAEKGIFVTGDRDRLEQLILILLSNSLLHTPAGGEIRLRLRREGRRALLTVEDTGDGFSEKALARAFQPGENDSLSGTGSGLGLYIAQGIARFHGGVLLLENRPERGARVTLSLPLSEMLSFRDAEPLRYRGPSPILTELCDVLSLETYKSKFLD